MDSEMNWECVRPLSAPNEKTHHAMESVLDVLSMKTQKIERRLFSSPNDAI
jgi:hypothetical protein